MSTLAPVRGSRATILAALAALVALVAAAPAAAEPTPSRLAGPDLPGGSDPSLARQPAERPISAGRLERELARLARRAPGASGYFVKDLDARGGAILFDRSEGRRRKLASNQKLFTTITALHVLGPDERLQTRVKVEGEPTEAGRLRGDVYLVGGGDPSLGSAGMADLAERVSKAGVKRIGGRVIADDSIFDRRRGVADSRYDPSPYIAPLSGLVFDGSTYDLDPALEAGQAFRDALRGAGVKIEGKVKVGEIPGTLRDDPELASHGSDPVGELVRATNKPSDNFYAEMLLKAVAAAGGEQGTTERGARVVKRYAGELGSGVKARDGSGLTAGNKSSPREVVALLDAVQRQKELGAPLFDSLAIAGKDGTLHGRMEGTAAAGSCRGKTGTISGVSNLSGYCKAGGGLVAFSLLMNGVGDVDAARDVQDRMVVEIAKYRGE